MCWAGEKKKPGTYGRANSKSLSHYFLAECAQPGVSVAGVALSHGINANVVHNWRSPAYGPSLDPQVPSFVPVALPASSSAPVPEICIELRRGATSVSLTWPVSVAEDCAAWMRDLLK